MSYETVAPAATAEGEFMAAQQSATQAAESATRANATAGNVAEKSAAARPDNAAVALPRWREISGLTVEREADLTSQERTRGIRALVKEVERLARIEFKEEAPAGERTCLWDPLAKVCLMLQISRTKLSNLSRELTGMRAHELTDRIQAETLPQKLMARLRKMVLTDLQAMGARLRSVKQDPQVVLKTALILSKHLRKCRSGPMAAGWAAQLGFANASRLNRACLLAHRMSLSEIEFDLIYQLVQKFLDERDGKAGASAAPGSPPYKEGKGPEECDIDAKAEANRTQSLNRIARKLT